MRESMKSGEKVMVAKDDGMRKDGSIVVEVQLVLQAEPAHRMP
jgi:hypothetical protein